MTVVGGLNPQFQNHATLDTSVPSSVPFTGPGPAGASAEDSPSGLNNAFTGGTTASLGSGLSALLLSLQEDGTSGANGQAANPAGTPVSSPADPAASGTAAAPKHHHGHHGGTDANGLEQVLAQSAASQSTGESETPTR